MKKTETFMPLKQTMALASLPFGLIDLSSLNLDFANDALQHHLKANHLGTDCIARSETLQSALNTCLASQQERSTQEPATATRTATSWHFLPVLEDGRTVAVQCYLLAGNSYPAPPPSAEPTGLERTELKGTDRFEVFLDHLPYHVWIATPKGELTWLNKVLTQYAYNHSQRMDLGLSEAKWIDLVHPDDLATVNAGLSRALITEQTTSYRLRVKSHSGPYHWFLATLAPVKNQQGDVQFWVGANIAIDKLKQSEFQFQERIDALKNDLTLRSQELKQTQAVLAQIQKVDLVSHFSAGVAHDLNNLLFVTSLHAGLLEKNIHDPAQREHLEVIHETIKKAGRLASQLTGFSSRKPLTLSSADPRSLIQGIEDLLTNAVGAETAFRIHMPAQLWPICVDKMYFENALINLSINARDAVAAAEEGVVSLTLENVTLNKPGLSGDFVQISMSDNGSGMSEETQARIFEPFYTTKADGKGAGLGMPMVKIFMDQSSGVIEVESTVGKGSCIRLYFPRTNKIVQTQPEAEAIAEGSKETILIIEDDLPVRNAMAQVLYTLGYEVATAYTPEVAMRYLNSGMTADLIISDIKTPGRMSAVEMCQQLAEDGRNIPMLFTTGYSDEMVREQALVGEEYTVLFKPVSVHDLANAVHRLLLGEGKGSTSPTH